MSSHSLGARSRAVSLLVPCLLAVGARAAPAKPPAAAAPEEPAQSLLARAHQLYEGLEYDKVIPLAEAVLAKEGVSLDEKLDAYLLQGSSLAIVGDPVEAEKPFRLLLRGRPDFDMKPDTPPKILAVFRKVQVEERAIADQLKDLERRRIVAGLKLMGEKPTEVAGGRAVRFAFRVKDPTNAVESVRVQYRKNGEPAYSSLALARDEQGQFVGAIPGEYTASESGFTLEYFVETADPSGPLLFDGTAQAPNRVPVAAGQVDRGGPPPVPLWAFGGVAGTSVLLVGAGIGLGSLVLVQQDVYRKTAAQGLGGGSVAGATLVQQQHTGDALAISANVAYGAAAIVGVAALAIAPFVNWTGESAEDDGAT